MDPLFYLFSGLRWQDLLDVALNTYILFRFYVLFRGTNVIRVLLGLCLLWVLSRAAVPLGLIVTNWAIQGVIAAAAFVIVIVFRNEISSVLQTKDLKSILWGIPRHQFHTPLDCIVDSVFELAQQRIGALIVLPMKKSLDNVVQSGLEINARLSKEMLISVFWPNNPLHDGGVIVQGDQITQAGVILPLSRRMDLPARFGTRHRAAMGLTEVSDALVICVSEERGTVTAFRENQIYEVFGRSELKQLLTEHTLTESGTEGLRHQWIELIVAAAISLACTTGIWMSFSKGMETLATYEVPVEFMLPGKNMEILSSSVSKVSLLVSGTRPLITALKAEQIKVKMDLARFPVGENRLFLTSDNISLPPGIRLKTIEPSQMEILLDIRMEKTLPVQPHWTGKLPDGLVMRSATPVPATVRVAGGASALEKMTTLFTESIALDGQTPGTGTVETAIALDSGELKLLNADKIQIQYEIVEGSNE